MERDATLLGGLFLFVFTRGDNPKCDPSADNTKSLVSVCQSAWQASEPRTACRQEILKGLDCGYGAVLAQSLAVAAAGDPNPALQLQEVTAESKPPISRMRRISQTWSWRWDDSLRGRSAI